MILLHAALRLMLGLLPVLFFLGVLILLDSYKLVRIRLVVCLLAAGGAAAVLSLLANLVLMDRAGLDGLILARYAAPVGEEMLKGLVVVSLVARRRVGFLVDAAICGFAVGAGFAAVENLHYFLSLPHSTTALWVIRGFGTALMHGSVTAAMAIVSKSLCERRGGPSLAVFLPGWLLAMAVHSIFNHFFLAPSLSAAILLLTLPGFFIAVFHMSERTTRRWLGVGFDSDSELLELINSGTVSDSRVGGYLRELSERFDPPVVADMLCLLRLRCELSIRAKGVLLARKAGFELPPDPEMKDRFTELRFLEHSIGTTGLLAMKPVFCISDHDLWQYNLVVNE